MYSDLDRPPLRAAALSRALRGDGWRVEVVEEVASTNAAVAERARAGEPAGLVLAAERQTGGRGRHGREWLSPPRAGLTFSVLLRPEVPRGEWPWTGLLAGLAVARALRERAGVDAVLKWPNDVLVGEAKVAGLLAETAGTDALVVGIGLNVSTRQEELPVPTATSLALAAAETTDRDTLLRAVLRSLTVALADPPGSRAAYRALCRTIGSAVRLDLPGGATVEGLARAVDGSGRLVVGDTAYSAGDVVHLRRTH